ncbi:MAG TPA: hypothetical protein VD838_23100 [Anaeromyxobacteraceae bacterium]|nr:hypothetical protein [Anaeromyxobacteraceae bacterium]
MNVERVLIKADGFYGEDESGVLVPLADRTLSYLSEPVAIAAGVTLGDLLRAVSADESLTEFVAAYAHCPGIAEFHAEAARPYAPEPTSDFGLVALELTRHVRASWHAWDFPDDEREDTAAGRVWRIRKVPKATPYYELELDVDLAGVDVAGRPYAIELTPLDRISGLPLALQEEATLVVDEPTAEHKSSVVRARTTFTLLEVLEGVYAEIGFCGTPANRDVELGKIRESYDEGEAAGWEAGTRVEFVDA